MLSRSNRSRPRPGRASGGTERSPISALPRSTERTRSVPRTAQTRPQGRQGVDRDVLLNPPAWLESAKVLDMVLVVPKVGTLKATKTLDSDSCRVSLRKTLGGLTDRPRAELLARLNQ